jgi:hypothetical protein
MDFLRLLEAIKKTPDYSLSDLFKIRDALEILRQYNMEDRELLEQVSLYIREKVDRQ